MATVTQNDAPSVGLDVAFSRSIAGQRPDYKWVGTTDKDGQVEIEIVADSGQFSRIGTTGYYLIRSIDPLSGEIAGQWGSLPINGGYEVLLSLPIGGTARLNAVSPLSGVSEPRASETPIGDTASLIDHLRAFGATAEPSGEISQPFFSVAGQIITVNGDGVQVFGYHVDGIAGLELVPETFAIYESAVLKMWHDLTLDK